MIFKRGRYSGFLRPISYTIDLLVINLLPLYFFNSNFEHLNFIIFVSLAWIMVSLKTNFYEIYRFTQVTRIVSLVGQQGAIFFLIVFAFFGFYNDIARLLG